MTTGTVHPLIADYLSRLAVAASDLPASRRAELLDEIGAHILSAQAARSSVPIADLPGSTDGPGSADGSDSDDGSNSDDVSASAGGAARAAGGEFAEEARIRTILDRLGDPEEIAAAARDDDRPVSAAPPVPLRQPVAVWEIVTFAMLTLGSFIPVIGWLIGVVLLWGSRRWRVGEKILATLIVPGGPGVVLLFLLLVPAKVCTTTQISTAAGGTADGATSCSGFAFPAPVGIPLFLFMLIGPFIIGGILLHRAVARAAAEPAVPARSRWGGLEVATILLLGPGSVFVPVLAPIIGLVCAWSSRNWTRLHKTVATVIAVIPSAVLAVVFGTNAAPVHAAIIVIALASSLGPIIAAIYLALALPEGGNDLE